MTHLTHVTLSKAKGLALQCEILRCAQNDNEQDQ